MEGGSSSGEAMKAAPRKGALWIVIAIVIAVAVTAAVMDLAVLPLLQPAQTGCVNARTSCVKIHVTTFDVGYDQPDRDEQQRGDGSRIPPVQRGSDHDPEFREGRPRSRPSEQSELGHEF